MNIGNITSNNMNLTENARFMQIELYEKEIERLQNIIKEVRYYIVTHKLYNFKYDEEELFEITTDEKAKDELLKILDNVGDK